MAKITAPVAPVAPVAQTETPTVQPQTEQTAEQPQTEKPAEKPAELTNAKIVELQDERKQLRSKLATVEPDSDEQDTIISRIVAIKTDIANEQANIKNEIAAAAVAEIRSKTADLLQSVIDLHNAEKTLFVEFMKLPVDSETGKRDETATNEMNAATAAAKNVFETVLNRLLGKPAKTITAATQTGEIAPVDNATAEYWKNRDNILKQHVINLANGMDNTASNKHIQSLGAKRSTVWFAIDAFNKQPK